MRKNCCYHVQRRSNVDNVHPALRFHERFCRRCTPSSLSGEYTSEAVRTVHVVASPVCGALLMVSMLCVVPVPLGILSHLHQADFRRVRFSEISDIQVVLGPQYCMVDSSCLLALKASLVLLLFVLTIEFNLDGLFSAIYNSKKWCPSCGVSVRRCVRQETIVLCVPGSIPMCQCSQHPKGRVIDPRPQPVANLSPLSNLNGFGSSCPIGCGRGWFVSFRGSLPCLGLNYCPGQ